ncbi:MAG: NHL repeat-containing protein [Candidatus Staskawiczbacteria bacterium]|nr:NHL repeat-containing protein [Candidatus Staskawiczbacteria bacterium]
MKQTKYFFLFSILFFLCFSFNIFATNQSQFPDVLKLQPIPSGVHPGTSGNKNMQNPGADSSLLQQIGQYEFNESNLDPNTSYIDTINHLLFISDTENNCVLVFDLNQDNVLVDYIPDYILGQPDFTSSDPGTTQSTLNGPTGLAYDPENNKLFVADTKNNRVMIFDTSSITNGENAVNVLGQPNFTSSDPGTDQSSLDSPTALDYDPVNKILFVTDTNNNRVVTFDVVPAVNGENAVNVLGQSNFTSSNPGAGESALNNPYALAYNPASRELFVADTNNNRVMVFSVISTNNGEEAVNIINSTAKISALSPKIATKMQSKLKENAVQKQNKNSFFNSTFFWIIISLIILIIIIAVIFVVRRNKEA